MKLTSATFHDGQAIPAAYAFCRRGAETRAELSDNISPELAWSDWPDGTRSFALVCVDPDVPSRADDVNREGRSVPADLPRVDFFHWLLVDIPPSVNHLDAGADSAGVTPRGKGPAAGPEGARRGINDYTKWFAGDAAMEGRYWGYDGPCPPWNDSIPHRYLFTVYALDLVRCPVDGEWDGPALLQAIDGHVLASASITGSYSLNSAVPA